jgi:Trk K+ transport system NAD-binding subunit
MAQIETTLPEHTVVPLMNLEGSGLTIVDLHLQEGAPADGRPIRDIRLPENALISLVVGADGPTVPDGNTVLHSGDEVIAVIPLDAEEIMRELITGRPVAS